MCAGSKEGELETIDRLLDIYPKGILSVVSDTWDLWKVLTQYIPALREKILARDGKLVIRPDSGDPVKILCGDSDADGPANHGAIKLLARALGTDHRGASSTSSCPQPLPLISKGGVIYGDGINLDRADRILTQTRTKLGLSPYNVVFGIGSFTYEYVTRDTYGFAMKATAIENAEGVVPIFKCPVTDDGGKKSLRGIPIVQRDIDGKFLVYTSKYYEDLERCAFNLVLGDGVQSLDWSFDEISDKVRSTAKEMAHQWLEDTQCHTS